MVITCRAELNRLKDATSENLQTSNGNLLDSYWDCGFGEPKRSQRMVIGELAEKKKVASGIIISYPTQEMAKSPLLDLQNIITMAGLFQEW
jgi:hypothetical protein